MPVSYSQNGNILTLTLADGTGIDFVVSGDGKAIMASSVDIQYNVQPGSGDIFDVMVGSIYVGARVGPSTP